MADRLGPYAKRNRRLRARGFTPTQYQRGQERSETRALREGFKNIEEAQRYRKMPRYKDALKRIVLERDYNTVADLSDAQRRAALGIVKYRRSNPSTDHWNDRRFSDYIEALFGRELTEDWIAEYTA